ncbi:hypothetical protein Cgig2_017226 [Carnegiea gigantea]|uniref:Pectinesterase inhibitor domain-containing protein n=1 Tax=Carnegiea gigantea TaxID=171969 RepID=A0A9Q1GJS6_9CARY|nr:hypothetical protein Cgig2_017226 [Carnegiea gigantea]
MPFGPIFGPGFCPFRCLVRSGFGPVQLQTHSAPWPSLLSCSTPSAFPYGFCSTVLLPFSIRPLSSLLYLCRLPSGLLDRRRLSALALCSSMPQFVWFSVPLALWFNLPLALWPGCGLASHPDILYHLCEVPCIKRTHIQAHNPIANNFIGSMCTQTPDPKLRETVIRSDPRSSRVKDPKSLALLMIDIVKSRFSDSVKCAKDMTMKTHDLDVIWALKKCVWMYQDVVINHLVKTTIYAVEMGDLKFGEEAMTGSGNTADGCQSEFPVGKIPPELPSRTQTLHGICNVVAAIIKTLG